MLRMRCAASRLLIASASVLASSCGPKPRPVVGIHPPADLLTRAPEPATPVEALISEEAHERSRRLGDSKRRDH